MSKKSLIAAACLALSMSLAPLAAQASVTYDFTAKSSFAFNHESVAGSFSATVPGFITSQQQLPLAQLTHCSVTTSTGAPASCLAQDFLFGVAQGYETIGFQITSAANPDSEFYYYFNTGAFETPGTYTSKLLGAGQFATLTVTQTSAVPEAGSLSMMMAGLGMLAVALRRRLQSSKG